MTTLTPDALLAAARASAAPLVYEAWPSRRWFRAADLPRGYAGEAYGPDDPRCRAALAEDLAAGWSLETPEQIGEIA